MPKLNVSRAMEIEAPLERVFEEVRNFKRWNLWSPWVIAEPDCPMSYREDGKQYGWNGKIIGSGEMEITGEKENEWIDYELRFFKPWKSQGDVRISFASKGAGTEVTWKIDSSLPFFMFFFKKMMEALIGMDYRRGLLMLKDLVETGSVPSRLEFASGKKVEGWKYVGIRTEAELSSIEEAMERDFGALRGSGIEASGKAFSIYHKWDMVKGKTIYTAAIPVEEFPTELPEGMVADDLPACEAYTITHTGPYRHLGNAWGSGIMRQRNGVFKVNKKVMPFEIYETEPVDGDESGCVTVVHMPSR